MRLSLIQSDIVWNDPIANIKKGWEALSKIHSSDLIVFPEMFTTGFMGEAAESTQKVSSEFLETAAKEKGTHICGSLPTFEDDKPKNTLRLYGPAGHRGDYSKIHLFSFDGEHTRYSPGNKTLTTKISDMRVSFAICYDLRFPGLFSTLAKDTDVFVIVANWPEVRQEHWESLLKARAIESQCFVAGVNRVGKNGNGVTFGGATSIYDPQGKPIARLVNEEGVVEANLDVGLVSTWREKFPALNDRLADYNSLKRLQA